MKPDMEAWARPQALPAPEPHAGAAHTVAWAYEAELYALSRWLHDGPLQALVAARRILELGDSGSDRLTATAVEALDQELQELRVAIVALSAEGLDHLGLAGALREVLGEDVEVEETAGTDESASAASLTDRLALRSILWRLEPAPGPSDVPRSIGRTRVSLNRDSEGRLEAVVAGTGRKQRAVAGPGERGAEALESLIRSLASLADSPDQSPDQISGPIPGPRVAMSDPSPGPDR